MVNQFPDEDVEVMGIQLQWKVEMPSEQKTGFAELLQKLVATIGPGDSLKTVRVIADDALPSEILSLTGEYYQSGSYYPEGVTVPIEGEGTFLSIMLIRQAFFAPSETISGEKASLEQISTLVEELYHSCLYHLAWQYRGYIDLFSADPYSDYRFTVCRAVHDEYAVARLKNMFFGTNFGALDEQGQPIPYFIEYGLSLAAFFDQVPDQLHNPTILQIAPSERKNGMLPIAYRFIFEPLARHAGFLAPVPPDYLLQAPENTPESTAFYREVIAPYWTPIKSALEASFDSQFSKTEEALQDISEVVDACLDRLRQEYAI